MRRVSIQINFSSHNRVIIEDPKRSQIPVEYAGLLATKISSSMKSLPLVHRSLFLGLLIHASLAQTQEGATATTVAPDARHSIASLGVTVDWLPNVPDIARRRTPRLDEIGNEVAVENFSVLDSRFHLDFVLFQTANYLGALRASIIFRNAFEREDPVYPSTEYGGHEFSYLQRFGRFFSLKTQYADRRSQGLRLMSSHHALMNEFLFEIAEDLGKSKDQLYLKVGPNITLAKTYGLDRNDIYDPSWGAVAKIRYQTTDPLGFPVAFAVEGLFQRIMGYRLDGIDHGGAGLMTITPEIEYMLSKELWIGAYAHIPTLRPLGREEAFGNGGLPGLYGHSGGTYIKSTSF